ncbi:hypothetical protein HYH02_001921 [Chlamydomonas schloesseri]|uniref:SF4 helicase domain-containing protein n=1 Tax=Chlamydomonas schloesseri TaxID=2026947 RepID=A0A835WUK3_9CHLO|nr:hypothetical protein HYH02_001921 [Chlamydomonas schloesseri]|eukprot:KAG2453709.1 hypothetical protein HYH02_001921 [Chlamydomonas schloesseri]
MHSAGLTGPARASVSSTGPEAPSAPGPGAKRSLFPRPRPAAPVPPGVNGAEHDVASAPDAARYAASSSAGAYHGSYHTRLGPLAAGLLGYHSRRHGAAALTAAAALPAATASPLGSASSAVLTSTRCAGAAACVTPPAASGAGSARAGPHSLLGGGPPLRLLLMRCHALGGGRGGRGRGRGSDSDGESAATGSGLSSAKINCSECGAPLRISNLVGHFEKGCSPGLTSEQRQHLIAKHQKLLNRVLDGDGGGMLPPRSGRARQSGPRNTVVMLREDAGSSSGGEREELGQGEAGRPDVTAGAPGPAPAPLSRYRSRSSGAAGAAAGGSGSGSAGEGAEGDGSGAAAPGSTGASSSGTGAAVASGSASSTDDADGASDGAVAATSGAGKRAIARNSSRRRTSPLVGEGSGSGGAGTAVLDRSPGPGEGAPPGDNGMDGSDGSPAPPAGSALGGGVPAAALQGGDMPASAALAGLQLPGDALALAAAGLAQEDGLLPPSPSGSPPGSPRGSPSAASSSQSGWLDFNPAAIGGAGGKPAARAPAAPAGPVPPAEPTSQPSVTGTDKPRTVRGTWGSLKPVTVSQQSPPAGAGASPQRQADGRYASERAAGAARQAGPNARAPAGAGPQPAPSSQAQPPAQGPPQAQAPLREPVQGQGQGQGQSRVLEAEEDGPVPVLDPIAAAAEVANVDNGLTGSRRAMAVAGVEASARRPAPAAAPAAPAAAAATGGAGPRQAAGGPPPDNEKALRDMMKAHGGLQGRAKKVYKMPYVNFHQPPGFDPRDPYYTSLTPEALAWLRHTRRISDQVIRAARLYVEPAPPALDKGTGKELPRLALCFPYFVHGRIVNVKKRFFVPEWPQPFAKKDFRLGYGCELVAYGHDDLLRHVAAAGGGGGGGGAVAVVVVEGEMDKLALNTAGYWNVVSVPNGAALAKLNPDDPDAPPRQQFSSDPDRAAAEEARYYSWLDSLMRVLPDPTKAVFVLATDTDTAGRGLRAELMRRLGRERCWEVTSWDNEFLVNALGELGLPAASGEDQPASAYTGGSNSGGSNSNGAGATYAASGSAAATSNNNGATAAAAASVDTGRRKDANDVLVLDGPERLARLLAEEARPAKLRGLATFREYEEALTSYYLREDPLALGVSTGWPSLDKYYRVAPGELTIVTGIPNSGKSEFLDALLVNLAENHGWAFAMCSLEKGPVPHLKALIEKRMRKPFRNTWHNGQPVPAMSLPEVVSGFQWVADHFHLIRHDEVDDTGSPTIDWVLNMARIAVMRYGIRGLLIDPYNELDSRRGRDVTETDHIKEMLTRVRKFARETDCHVWFVAHPRQQHAAKTGAKGGAAGGTSPGLYDISGSAHWFNKTDNGIVVHRRFEVRPDPVSGKEVRVALPEVEIKLQKVRNKDVGTQGQTHLLYDRPTGRYADCEPWPDKARPLDAVERRSRDLAYLPAVVVQAQHTQAAAAEAAAVGAAAAQQSGAAALPAAASGSVVDTTASPVSPAPPPPPPPPAARQVQQAQQPYAYGSHLPPHAPPQAYNPNSHSQHHLAGPHHAPGGPVGPNGTYLPPAASSAAVAPRSHPTPPPAAAGGGGSARSAPRPASSRATTSRSTTSPSSSTIRSSSGLGSKTKGKNALGTKELQGRAQRRNRATQQPPAHDDDIGHLDNLGALNIAGALQAEKALGIGGHGGGPSKMAGDWHLQEGLEQDDDDDEEEGGAGGLSGKRTRKSRAPAVGAGSRQVQVQEDGETRVKEEEKLPGLSWSVAENEGAL